ncbi:response regulator [Parvibaculum sp.]|jgi:DNA-binding response OmpR family regulator|uniref:response regulator n=1 Tax=Parvibaculum sp. TaxID=2024848 RepID=UPI001B08BE23|nr:response regulator [Parvibaculum sp.]MBO6667744.1 response regulator [Parvibaculum sp.]MBO6693176.1 response regulator [Parvibaculum sp.]MBO6715171.1 response regulator [Parvibaculum sp.]|tara:strand:- start:7565 stop:8062 length:498 start_codon:yes stop_codon:yes gene_type:complete
MSAALFGKLTILVVDDSAYMRHLLMTLLQALGVKEVLLAIDGDEAWDLLQSKEPDIIITDAAMMPVDGFSFASRLRSIRGRALGMVPIIMVSGHTDIASVERARDIGISEFLSKPISARGLYERLIQVLDRPRQFVETPTYRGPDRRRRDRPFEGEDRRGAVALI